MNQTLNWSHPSAVLFNKKFGWNHSSAMLNGRMPIVVGWNFQVESSRKTTTDAWEKIGIRSAGRTLHLENLADSLEHRDWNPKKRPVIKLFLHQLVWLAFVMLKGLELFKTCILLTEQCSLNTGNALVSYGTFGDGNLDSQIELNSREFDADQLS